MKYDHTCFQGADGLQEFALVMLVVVMVVEEDFVLSIVLHFGICRYKGFGYFLVFSDDLSVCLLSGW